MTELAARSHPDSQVQIRSAASAPTPTRLNPRVLDRKAWSTQLKREPGSTGNKEERQDPKQTMTATEHKQMKPLGIEESAWLDPNTADSNNLALTMTELWITRIEKDPTSE